MNPQYLLRTVKKIMAAGLVFASLAGPAKAQQPLTLWIHPYLPATELVKRFSPLVKYLEKTIGRPVTIRIQKSYEAHIFWVGHDHADLAFMGPASYVKMTRVYGRKPIIARLETRRSPVFYGMIIVRQESPIKSLADLAGKRFAFGDPNSTMNYLVPLYMLHKAGVEVNDLGKYEFLGNHDNIALGVIGGYYDAGGVKEEIFYKYRKRGLRLLAKGPPIPEHLFVARSSLPAKTLKTLRQAFMGLNRKEGGYAILAGIKNSITGLTTASDKDYDGLRNILKIVDQP